VSRLDSSLICLLSAAKDTHRARRLAREAPDALASWASPNALASWATWKKLSYGNQNFQEPSASLRAVVVFLSGTA
jgi:hypothetical protein